MNIWFCPIKPRSWNIVKTFRVFGFPRRASKVVNEIRPNDSIVFHVLKPVNGIIAICKVTSEVYEDQSNIWGINRYPLRVKIEFIPNLTRDESTTIPISALFYEAKGSDEIKIEPYLKNIWLVKITHEQYKRLKALFKINSHANAHV